MDIVSDLQDGEEDVTQSMSESSPKQVKLFLNKNNEFLEKEISFFISNLRNVRWF
jgi:hypothetical protein